MQGLMMISKCILYFLIMRQCRGIKPPLDQEMWDRDHNGVVETVELSKPWTRWLDGRLAYYCLFGNVTTSPSESLDVSIPHRQPLRGYSALKTLTGSWLHYALQGKIAYLKRIEDIRLHHMLKDGITGPVLCWVIASLFLILLLCSFIFFSRRVRQKSGFCKISSEKRSDPPPMNAYGIAFRAMVIFFLLLGALLAPLIALGSLGGIRSDVENGADTAVCETFRLPYSFAVGVTKQSEARQMLGLPEMRIPARWTGIKGVTDALEYTKIILGPSSVNGSVRERVETKIKEALGGGRDGCTIAAQSLLDVRDAVVKTASRLEDETVVYDHTLRYGDRAAHGFLYVVSALNELIGTLSEEKELELCGKLNYQPALDDFIQGLVNARDKVLESSELWLKDVYRLIFMTPSKALRDIFQKIGDGLSLIRIFGQHDFSSKEDDATWLDFVRKIMDLMTDVALWFPLLPALIFVISLITLSVNYRMHPQEPWRMTTCFLGLSWFTAYLWAVLLLTVFGFIWFTVTAVGQPCIILQEGSSFGWAQYPMVIEKADRMLQDFDAHGAAVETQPNARMLLDNTATYAGSGVLDGFLNFTVPESQLRNTSEAMQRIIEHWNDDMDLASIKAAMTDYLRTLTYASTMVMRKTKNGENHQIDQLIWDSSLQQNDMLLPELIFPSPSSSSGRGNAQILHFRNQLSSWLQSNFDFPATLIGLDHLEITFNAYAKSLGYTRFPDALCISTYRTCQEGEAEVQLPHDESNGNSVQELLQHLQEIAPEGRDEDVAALRRLATDLVQKSSLAASSDIFYVPTYSAGEMALQPVKHYSLFGIPSGAMPTACATALDTITKSLAGLTTLTADVVEHARELLRHYAEAVAPYYHTSKSLYAGILSVADPICRGAFGSSAALAVIWGGVGLAYGLYGIFCFVVWLHCWYRIDYLTSPCIPISGTHSQS